MNNVPPRLCADTKLSIRFRPAMLCRINSSISVALAGLNITEVTGTGRQEIQKKPGKGKDGKMGEETTENRMERKTETEGKTEKMKVKGELEQETWRLQGEEQRNWQQEEVRSRGGWLTCVLCMLLRWPLVDI